MFELTACNIIGYLAAICMILGYMPQAIYTLPTFLLMGLGGLFFIIQGFMTDNWPLVITNFITTTSSMIVFGIKLYNDYFKKK